MQSGNDSRFARQIGMVDQAALEASSLELVGPPEQAVLLAAMAAQVGFGRTTPISIVIEGDADAPLHHPIARMLAGPEACAEAHLLHLNERFQCTIGRNLALPGALRIGLHASSPVDVLGWVDGDASVITDAPMLDCGHGRHTLSTPALMTANAAALVHQALLRLGLVSNLSISGGWVVHKVRIETSSADEAASVVGHAYGDAARVTFQPTADGAAILASVRVPNTGLDEVLPSFRRTFREPSPLGLCNIGLRPWGYELPPQSPVRGPLDVLVVGAGGLGSWAIPHLADVLEGAGALAVVDGDAEVEPSNLNRQILFSHADVGRSKARAAESKIRAAWPRLDLVCKEAFLNETHLPNTSEMEAEGVSLLDLLDHDSQQDAALKDLVARSTHVLSCLDSMHARSLLNLATHHTGALLVNGACEGKHGLVEMLSPDTGCMRCRYGDAAFDHEVVSCTEEGRRPIAAIATVTAWAGSMMAARAALSISDRSAAAQARWTWLDGQITLMDVDKPPWFNQDCRLHLVDADGFVVTGDTEQAVEA